MIGDKDLPCPAEQGSNRLYMRQICCISYMVYWFLHTLLIFYLVSPFDLAEIYMSAFRHMLLPSLSLYISGQLLDLHSPKFPSDKVSCSVILLPLHIS